MKHKKLIIGLIVAALIIITAVASFFIYVNVYYEADMEAIAAYNYTGFDIREIDDGAFAYVPKGEYDTGIVFYPGGKVEHLAYVPLMKCLASKGILCVLVDMPYNLAVFDTDRATGCFEGFVSVKHWYMAGHSLGGSMACEYASDNQSIFEGVILLASYSSADLSQTAFKVLSIYGSNDGVLDMDSYGESKANLPASFEEKVIVGGNHAYFGVYGEQDGDGTATISNREQIEQATEIILEFLK